MRYNVKDLDKIQDTDFCCPACLTEELITALQFTRDYEGIDLIADADLITEVIRILLNIEIDDIAFTLGMVEIDGVGADYTGEYVLSINDDYTIWVEPAWRNVNGEEKLFDLDNYITYVHADCDSKILQKLAKEDKNVMIFDFENFED